MEKPLLIQIEETKKAIVDKINESGLSINRIENILKDLYNEVRLEMLNQLIKETQTYERQLMEKLEQ